MAGSSPVFRSGEKVTEDFQDSGGGGSVVTDSSPVFRSNCLHSSVAEHFLGKEEVGSPILLEGS